MSSFGLPEPVRALACLALAVCTGCVDSVAGPDDERVTITIHRIVFGGADGHAFQVGPVDPVQYWLDVGAEGCTFLGETARIADPDEIPGFPIPTILYDQTWECWGPRSAFEKPGPPQAPE